MDAYGVSKASADARDKGGIAVNNGLVSAEKYYAVVGGENPILVRVYLQCNQRTYSGGTPRLHLPTSNVRRYGADTRFDS